MAKHKSSRKGLFTLTYTKSGEIYPCEITGLTRKESADLAPRISAMYQGIEVFRNGGHNGKQRIVAKPPARKPIQRIELAGFAVVR